MSVFSKVFNFIFGLGGGLTKLELEGQIDRDRFSNFLPWVAYDRDTQQYLNVDNTIGFMWECAPMFFAGDQTTKTLEGLFRVALPEGSIMQFVLAAEPNVHPFLSEFAATKERTSELTEKLTDKLCTYFGDGVNGMPVFSGIPVRNYRMFFCVKLSADKAHTINVKDTHSTFQELLKGARLSPTPLEPEVLLDFTRRLFNDKAPRHSFHYDEGNVIRKQIILSENSIHAGYNSVKIGSKHFRCTTPKIFPREVNPFQTNLLFGAVLGGEGDSDQIRTPFIYSLNIICEDLKGKLHAKTNFILQQQAIGSWAPSLANKKEEFLWAAGELGKGKKFYRIIPTLWVYGEDERTVADSMTRAKMLWEAQGYTMQEDKGILPILLISSLPCGLYNIGRNIEMLDRDFVAPAEAISSVLPIQGDFSGFGREILPLVGRKGQLFGVDLYAKGTTSYNSLTCATTGGGKSFWINYLVYNYYTSGAKIRIIDIGGSYKKMTKLFGAKFLDFDEGSDVCLNPFTNVSRQNPQRTQADLMVIAPIVASMVFSSGNEAPTDTDMSLIKAAIRWAWQYKGNDADIDDVHMFLSKFRSYSSDGGVELADRAFMLAYNMTDFCSNGPYGKFFNGPSNFNISDNDFCVLELEALEKHKELFRVVTMQIINAVTQDLYMGDRSIKKVIIFDEAWKFLTDTSGGGHGGATEAIKTVISEGYRRCRKVNGSFNIITQSILDLKQFGSAGDVIKNASAFKFYLESGDFDKAKREGLLDHSDFVMSILRSLKSKVPYYSELFIESPFGMGVGRLAVDPFTYYVCTSTPGEVSEIEDMVGQGISYADAIAEMVRRYRSN
jgi:conjugal transfer ATP-binding protein TraC